MQCFQKDPNLRVSARKLLKHPWIVNARRSDSVVPTQPTKYDEAVKSVQEWNEALKSPNAGSLRRASRPMSSSPIPGRRDPQSILATPAKGPLTLAKPRTTAEHFRSPEGAADDNWDDDFASAISPSALQLPHLRPHDNFGGMLSAEKLKAYASFETVTGEENWDANFEGDLTVKSPLQLTATDPLQTIRPISKKVETEVIRHSAPTKILVPKRAESKIKRPTSPLKQCQSQAKLALPSRPSTLFRESSVEDYSDLIATNEEIFEQRLLNIKVRTEITFWCLHPNQAIGEGRFTLTKALPSL